MKIERAIDAHGWSRWVRPVMHGYKLGCCDCHLVHELEFRVLQVISRQANGIVVGRKLSPRGYRVEFRCRRMPRFTAIERK